MKKRRRFKETEALKNCLSEFAKDLRNEAAKLAPGIEQDALLKRARQADTAIRLEDQLVGLTAPR